MDFAFKASKKKRKVVVDEPAAQQPRPAPQPAAAAEPAPQGPKIDRSVAEPPESRRKSRVKAADMPAQPAAPPITPAAKPARRKSLAPVGLGSARTSVSAHADAANAGAEQSEVVVTEAKPTVDESKVGLAIRQLELVLQHAIKARADEQSGSARALGDVVARFLHLVKARPPAALGNLAGAAEALSKAALVEALESESTQWEAAQRSSLSVAHVPAPPVADEPLPPAAAIVDLAPELSELCVRAGFRLDEAEERLRWAHMAQNEARRTHLKAAELVHAKAFGAYEQVDDPQALLRAVAA